MGALQQDLGGSPAGPAGTGSNSNYYSTRLCEFNELLLVFREFACAHSSFLSGLIYYF